MSRTRSPGYPSMPLGQAIELVKKLHEHDRTNPVDREAAAKNIGYSGITGASAKALADLAHFGLVERAGKGALRVSQLAVDILYPASDDDLRRGLEEAATSPDLFAEIRAQFPDGIPSHNSLRSYLMRNSFATAAIPYVIKSYTETARLFEEPSAIESHGAPDSGGANLRQVMQPQDNPMKQSTDYPAPPAPPSPAPSMIGVGVDLARTPPPLNRINMNIQGDKVHLDATLDFKGLVTLEKKIQALKVLLETHTEANDTDGLDDAQKDDFSDLA